MPHVIRWVGTSSMKIFYLLTLTVILGAFSLRADIIYPDGAKPKMEPYTIKKLSKGLSNVIFFAFEFPRSMFEVTESEGVLSGDQITLGLMSRGPYRAMLRLESGFYDIGTAFDHNKTLLHLEPDHLDVSDIIPGYDSLFYWKTLDTPQAH